MVPADAEHEVLAQSSSFITKPVLVGAVAGALLGKSAGWAVAGGVAGWLYQNAREPQAQAQQAQQDDARCLGCGYGAVPRIAPRGELLSVQRPTTAIVPVGVAAEQAEDTIESDAAADKVAPTKKSLLPLLILAGGAYWLLK
jgi:hypothetical protein